MQSNKFRPLDARHQSNGRPTTASSTPNFPPLENCAELGHVGVVHDEWPQAVELSPTAFDSQLTANTTPGSAVQPQAFFTSTFLSPYSDDFVSARDIPTCSPYHEIPELAFLCSPALAAVIDNRLTSAWAPSTWNIHPELSVPSSEVLDWLDNLYRFLCPEYTNTPSHNSLVVSYLPAESSLHMSSNPSTGVYAAGNSMDIAKSTVTGHLPQGVVYQHDPPIQTDVPVNRPLPMDLALTHLTPTVTHPSTGTNVTTWGIGLDFEHDTIRSPPILSACSSLELPCVPARASASSLVDTNASHETLGVASNRDPPMPSNAHRQRTTTGAFIVRKIRQKSYSKGFIKRAIRHGSCSVSYGPNGYPLAHTSPMFSAMPKMDDGHETAFPEMKMGQKMSIRYQFDGYPPYTRQANVSTKNGQPTKARLASVSAREMALFCKRCNEQGRPFHHKLEDLVLLRIDVVSDGSLQPWIGVLEPA